MPRTITFGNRQFDDPGPEYTAEQIRTHLASIYPELNNAEPKVAANGDITFFVKAGTKGL